MLIRSQNKKYLVSTNNIIFYAMDSEVICFGISGIEDSDYIILGHYETETKVMKVLDMIQEAYADAELVPRVIPDIGKMFTEASPSKENELLAEVIGKMANNAMVFQIPEDSEVEV